MVLERNILPETAAQVISLHYIGITLGRFISGFLTIKLNNRQMFRLGYGVSACGAAALMLPFGNILTMAGFFILGLGNSPLHPSLLHETPKNFGSDKSQAIIGLQIASGCIGGLIIPPLFGRAASFTGFSVFPLFTVALLIIIIVIFEALNKKLDKTRIIPENIC